MTRRLTILLAALMLLAAACGGGDETTTEAPGDGGGDTPTSSVAPQPPGDTTPPPTEPPADTGAPPPPVVSGDFCSDAEANEALADGVDFFSADLEAAVKQWLDAIDAAVAAAPDEIRDDVAVLAEVARDFAALLEEANYNFLEIDPNDPRLLALEDGRIEQAIANIDAYCGFETDTGSGGNTGGGTGSGEFGNDPLPDYMTDEVVVPDLLGVDDNGAAGLNMGTSLSFEETVAYYEDLFGVVGIEDGGDVTINAQYEGATWILVIQEIDSDVTLVTVLRF